MISSKKYEMKHQSTNIEHNEACHFMETPIFWKDTFYLIGKYVIDDKRFELLNDCNDLIKFQSAKDTLRLSLRVR